MQKICVYGVGAIGGLLAARLALSGQTITGIARGAQLKAIQANGLTLQADGQRNNVPLSCTPDPVAAGPQDVIFVTLKSHALPANADQLLPLIGPDTVVVSVANGFPWWYFHGTKADHPEPLDSVDPGGRLWRTIGPERAIGAVVFPAARTLQPGVVEHVFGDRLVIGEPDGRLSKRVQALAAILMAAGFDAPVTDDIRAVIWAKLIANAAYNPVSLLTGGTLGDMLDDHDTLGQIKSIMNECVAVAAALDVTPAMTPEALLEGTRQLGGHKTSMLQDYESGRSLEFAPIAGAVVELGQRYGVLTPTLDQVIERVRSKVR
ncbi:MAG: 2-dehydropantoate 2-reductase [Gammaproteobacteria bacterium]|nr:2-dehydropantoate 2-reductase [Gammaproteobacteria bacterium]